MIKAVIFDVDGTLVDSVDAHAKTWLEAFAKFGHVFEFGAVRSQIGKGGDQLMPVFLSVAEIETRGKAIEEHRARLLKEYYLPGIEGFPQVRQLFQRLQADGIKTVLASSAKGEELRSYKEKAGISDLVEEETSSDDAERSKPHGDIFEAALAKLPGVSPHDAVVVGDTPYDAEAAAKAGLSTIGVLGGAFSEKELRQAGCIAIFANPADLLYRYKEAPWSDK